MCKENTAKGAWNKLNSFQTKGITKPIGTVHHDYPFAALKKKKNNGVAA